MILDLSSLEKAIIQLEEALAYCRSDLAKTDPRLARHLRAAAIQAFEFTYELSFKILKRFLVATEPNPSLIEEMSFNDLVRLGYGRGLLSAELVVWKGFRKDRGATSHTYDENKAQHVYESIPDFLQEVRYLQGELSRRQEP